MKIYMGKRGRCDVTIFEINFVFRNLMICGSILVVFSYGNID